MPGQQSHDCIFTQVVHFVCKYRYTNLLLIIIIIIIIIIISFKQGIYIPETNYFPMEYSVAAILLFLFMVHLSLAPVLNLLHFYISTFQSICAVPNMAVFCSSLTSWIIIIFIIITIPSLSCHKMPHFSPLRRIFLLKKSTQITVSEHPS